MSGWYSCHTREKTAVEEISKACGKRALLCHSPESVLNYDIRKDNRRKKTNVARNVNIKNTVMTLTQCRNRSGWKNVPGDTKYGRFKHWSPSSSQKWAKGLSSVLVKSISLQTTQPLLQALQNFQSDRTEVERSSLPSFFCPTFPSMPYCRIPVCRLHIHLNLKDQ